MNVTQVLESVGIIPEDEIFTITAREAMNALLEFIKEWELTITVEKINKKEWKTIFESYADVIIDYHPENHHQERAVFLKNKKLFKKYGLTDEDITRLEFC